MTTNNGIMRGLFQKGQTLSEHIAQDIVKKASSKLPDTIVPITENTQTTPIVSLAKPAKMKRWPENPSELLPYGDIISPLKEVLRKGYRLFRKDEIKSFDYEGYNIGKVELQNNPSPKLRFSEKFLTYEKALGHSLIDVVLNITFLLGVEQGRRAERRDSKPVETLLETLETYRETNKNLRIKIDELEIQSELKERFPQLTDQELQSCIKVGIEARKWKRIHELKKELQLDVSKSNFQFKTPVRAKFRDLESIAKSLNKKTCTLEQWKEILESKGWTYKEWKDKCKKKIIKTDFS